MPGRILPIWIAFLQILFVAPAKPETIQIIVEQLEFVPKEVKAHVGDTIIWLNKDVLDHTATAPDGFDVTIPAEQSGQLVLKKAGDVEYYCRFHPNMTGHI